MQDTHVRRGAGVKLPPELANILGTSGAILAVVATGSAISALLPSPDAWQVAASYLAPASLAFAVYWWVSQKV
jgi:hypothetical protein